MKKKVYFNEFNVMMDNTVYLPYASGLLIAYAKSIKELNDYYEFMPFIFIRESIDKIIEKYDNPAVAAFSVSSWNEQISLDVARRVKEKYSKCLIVFGGVQVPIDSADYLMKYKFIDRIVSGDGEIKFANILIDESPYLLNLNRIKHDENINNLLSPYLTGVFDYLFNDNKINYQAIIETNRGCPHGCAYCVWGKGSDNKKIRCFDLERIKAELEWISKHKIKYVFNADGNFGILPRDISIADLIIENKKKYGYPEKLRTCFTKNSDERIFELADKMVSGGIEKGITLSFQSLNKQVLKNIKRGNIKIDTYKKLLTRFNENKIPVYTELILGLPGETYQSWKDGIQEIINSGLQGQLFIYLCEVYPNTLLADKDYQKKYGIKTKRILMTETHGAIEKKEIPEYQEIIIETNTMSVEEWRKMVVFSWMAMFLFSMKTTFMITKNLKHKIEFTNFTEYIINHVNNQNKYFNIFKTIIDEYHFKIFDILDGLGKSQENINYGKIYWDMEELIFLRMSENWDLFYEELYFFIMDYLIDKGVFYGVYPIRQAIEYQKRMMPKQRDYPTKQDFAREVILWGRKSDKILKEVS